jgi:hypothetical protein
MIVLKYINGLQIITKKNMAYYLLAFIKLEEKVPERPTLKIFPRIFKRKTKDLPQTTKIHSI